MWGGRGEYQVPAGAHHLPGGHLQPGPTRPALLVGAGVLHPGREGQVHQVLLQPGEDPHGGTGPVQPPPSLPHETGSAGHEGGRARPSVHPGGDLHVPGQTAQILKLSDHEGETPIRHQLRPGSPEWLTKQTKQTLHYDLYVFIYSVFNPFNYLLHPRHPISVFIPASYSYRSVHYIL